MTVTVDCDEEMAGEQSTTVAFDVSVSGVGFSATTAAPREVTITIDCDE